MNKCENDIKEAQKLSRTYTAMIEEFKYGDEISTDFYENKFPLAKKGKHG